MKNVKEISAGVLSSLRAAGADFAYCAVTEGETREFNVDGGQFSLFRTLFDNAVTMTAFKDQKRGTISLNSTDDGAVAEAVHNCLASASSGQPDEAWAIAPTGDERLFTEGVPEPELDRFFDRTRELMDDIAARHPKILVEQMIVCHKSYRQCYRNTSGAVYETVGGQYSLELTFSAHEGEKSSSFAGTGVVFTSLEQPFIELGSMETDLADAERQIDTVPMTGKFQGTMVLTPACLGDFMDSMLDNFAGDRSLLEGTSIWKDALGKQVADPRLTVAFRPFDPRIVCGDRFTSEGFLAEDCDVIRDGVLKNYLLSLFVANKTGRERLKNDGAAMIVEPGEQPLAEIIRGVERGILVGRFSGGDPGVSGEFSGVAKNSFLIEHGEITCALSETMISGNLAQLLRNVVAISRETVCDGGSVLPYAAFGGVTVSGK